MPFRDSAANFGPSWPYTGYPSPAGTGDVTTWNYQASTGLLTSKVDAANRTVDYTYNARGQLLTREWARTLPSSSTRVKTTYGYDANTAEQVSITYNDGTPNLSYTYDRRGLSLTVTDATGTRTFEHCDCGKVTKESLAAFYGSRELRWMLDASTTGAKGRTTSLTMGSAGNGTDEYVVGYGYDGYGRLNHVNGVDYTYAGNSNLIATATDVGGSWVQTRAYETQRDLLTAIETKHGSAVKARFAYSYDALGRRKDNTQTGEIFASYVNAGLKTNYGYNNRSEVTSSQTVYQGSTTAMLGRDYAYDYDPIGNRRTHTVDGATSTYTTNGLNQYTQRTDPGRINGAGLAPAAAAVTVGGQAATLQGEYFYKSLTVNNGPAALWTNLSVSSSLGGSVTRGVFTPKTPVAYTYDADGNLLSDGEWDYTWDAENRLTGMSVAAVAASAGRTNLRLAFRYDYLGRRVAKKKFDWSGTGWVARWERIFLYDGWNMIAEYANSGGLLLLNHYVWGIDLMGSLQDAGGVGGLLRTYSYETGSQIVLMPAYDGNGNIYAATERTGGALRVIREYSPYGETLRSTGDFAQRYMPGFSTKYTDQESQNVYYGYRYYNPTLGRFVGRDPMAEKGGLNLYAILRNNPIARFDVLGMNDADDKEKAEDKEERFIQNRDTETSSDIVMMEPVYAELFDFDTVLGLELQSAFEKAMQHVADPTGDYDSSDSSDGQENDCEGQTDGDQSSTPSSPLDRARDGGADGMSLDDYRRLAQQIGWNGFQQNLSERQQEYYGKTAANILRIGAAGGETDSLWSVVVGEVPGVITDGSGLTAGDSADLVRAAWLQTINDPGLASIGGVISGYTRHGLNQAISRDAVGVSPSAILDAVRYPINTSQAGDTTVYLGRDAKVVVNRSGKIITVHATRGRGVRATTCSGRSGGP